MESMNVLVPLMTIAFLAPYAAAQSNTNSACTGPMLRSFGSCIGFLTTGSNASSPTSACCNSLRDLMSNGQDCLCLIVSGGVPFQVPVNRSLAISLPKACRQSGVPIECKATASPVPAPEPRNSNPGAPNRLSPPSIPQVPFIPQPSPSSRMTPQGDLVPTLTPPGMRPTLSAAQPSPSVFPSLLVVMMGGLSIYLC
ncbi:non-specific lipid transfer protein GPI-anchored 20-like isoform X1 [Salvia divinorum]|uniref:Non-specific lipid transfer protein GPI-anchored 20-like isoform X1 n=1 Tax=Salvia divinorum TaxID=28513 RepID=A0ABD1FWA8_SALDI